MGIKQFRASIICLTIPDKTAALAMSIYVWRTESHESSIAKHCFLCSNSFSVMVDIPATRIVSSEEAFNKFVIISPSLFKLRCQVNRTYDTFSTISGIRNTLHLIFFHKICNTFYETNVRNLIIGITTY